MQTIIIRIILNEESHDLQLATPAVFAALREHKEFFVLFQRQTLSSSIVISHVYGKQNNLEQNSLFLNLTSNIVADRLLQTLLRISKDLLRIY